MYSERSTDQSNEDADESTSTSTPTFTPIASHPSQSFLTQEREELFLNCLMFHGSSTGDLQLIKELIDHGVSVNIRDYDKRTPLHIASAEDHLEIVELLCKYEVQINARDRWGNTALQNATSRKAYRVINFLKEKGADLGNSGPLIQLLGEAAQNDDVHQLRLLIQAGVSVNLADFDGRTALHKAASNGSIHAIQFLVQHGAKLNVKDRLGATPLDYARDNKKHNVYQILSHSFFVDSPNLKQTVPPKREVQKESAGIFSFLSFGNNEKKLENKTITRVANPTSDLHRQAPATIEMLAKDEVDTREYFSGRAKNTSKTTIFEQFLVIGGGEDAVPKVVFQFPDNKTEIPPGIADFCFPSGIASKFVPKTKKSNSTNPPQVIHSSNKQNSFIFVITNQTGNRFYCLAVIDDTLEIIPPFIPKTTKIKNPLCYCLITQYPLFPPFFKFIYNILDSIYYGHLLKTNKKEEVIDLLSSVYNCILPVPGEMLRFLNSKVRMPFEEEESLLLLNFTEDILFYTLSETKLAWLLCAMLCEYKVLFICSDIRKLSAIVLSLIPILHPLKFKSSIIPVLPEKMVHILEAPCPLIAGILHNKPLKEIDIPSDLIVIDLNATNIQIQAIPEKPVLPTLPNHQKLIETLNYFYPKKQEKSKPKENQTNPLIVQLNTYISSLLKIEKHCVTDRTRDVTVFWKELFIESQPPECAEFYKAFVKTQMFQTYTDEYVRAFDKKRLNEIQRSPSPTKKHSPPNDPVSPSIFPVMKNLQSPPPPKK